MLRTLHSKIGDLWWYSAMIFVACRSGDVIQAFIGLWLVPRYIDHGELGAVLPLQQLSTLFAVPLATLAIVFSKFVNTYAAHGEYGKVKCFIRDILVVASLVFLICISIAYLVIPHFYERLRITSGSLTILILAAGFTSNISQLLTNALQGLKKFKTLTVVNLISAPIRLVTLLIAMPFRPLSGYILGQATPPASSSLVAAIAIRMQLRAITIDTSWRRDIPAILRYFWPIAIYTAFGTLFSAISTTVYRQRLPEVESAAYYLLSRFAEIAGYVGLSMMVVLFPLASEAHENGREDTSSLRHTTIATAAVSILLASVFAVIGAKLFSLVETWRAYLPYVHLLPWITLITGAATIIGAVISYDMACRRFGIPFFIVIFNLLMTMILLSFTGWDFYRGHLSDHVVDWIANHNLASLTRLTWFCGISALIQIITIFGILSHRYTHQPKRSSNQ